MSRLNKATAPALTHEGTRVSHSSPEEQLRRAVLACMLWEDQFYEDGISISDRIKALVPQVDVGRVLGLAKEARTSAKLRHVPLLLLVAAAKYPSHHKGLAEAVEACIQRPDELAELFSIYAKENGRAGRKRLNRLPWQLVRGCKAAFLKFNEYSFAKYRGDGNEIKLRDVMFLTHPNPTQTKGSIVEIADKIALFKKIAENTLETPDTWEVALSAGGKDADKKAIWTRLLNENKLGGLALLRNLRNMQQAGVDEALVRSALTSMSVERVLPFRFVAASRFAPRLEPELETAMYRSLLGAPKLPGKTALIIDRSGSMDGAMSSKSDMTRLDAAAALAILIRELSETCSIWTFSNAAHVIPSRRGFALRDAIHATPPGGSYGGYAVKAANLEGYDRIIVLTDGQWHQMTDKLQRNFYGYEADPAKDTTGSVCPEPLAGKPAYMLNVASYQNGVGYGRWTVINGWSENCLGFIQAVEAAGAPQL